MGQTNSVEDDLDNLRIKRVGEETVNAINVDIAELSKKERKEQEKREEKEKKERKKGPPPPLVRQSSQRNTFDAIAQHIADIQKKDAEKAATPPLLPTNNPSPPPPAQTSPTATQNGTPHTPSNPSPPPATYNGNGTANGHAHAHVHGNGMANGNGSVSRTSPTHTPTHTPSHIPAPIVSPVNGIPELEKPKSTKAKKGSLLQLAQQSTSVPVHQHSSKSGSSLSLNSSASTGPAAPLPSPRNLSTASAPPPQSPRIETSPKSGSSLTLNSSNNAHSVVLCDNDQEANADVHCPVCSENYCNECDLIIHKNPSRRSHQRTKIAPSSPVMTSSGASTQSPPSTTLTPTSSSNSSLIPNPATAAARPSLTGSAQATQPLLPSQRLLANAQQNSASRLLQEKTAALQNNTSPNNNSNGNAYHDSHRGTAPVEVMPRSNPSSPSGGDSSRPTLDRSKSGYSSSDSSSNSSSPALSPSSYVSVLGAEQGMRREMSITEKKEKSRSKLMRSVRASIKIEKKDKDEEKEREKELERIREKQQKREEKEQRREEKEKRREEKAAKEKKKEEEKGREKEKHKDEPDHSPAKVDQKQTPMKFDYRRQSVKALAHSIRSSIKMKPIPVPVVKPKPQLTREEKAAIKLQAIFRGRRTRRMYKMLLARTNVVREILITELDYVRFMSVLLKVYVHPLSKAAKSSEPLLSEEEIAAIFPEIEVIQKYNNTLVSMIQKKLRNWSNYQTLGDIFLAMIDFLRDPYTHYISQFPKISEQIKICSQRVPVALFFEKAKKFSECASMDLISLVSMPFQRIPRYILLLKECLKFTPKMHQDHELLRIAIKKLEGLANMANDKLRDEENYQTVIRISERLDPPVQNLVRPYRRLVRDGPLLARFVESGATLSEKELKLLQIYLFTDCVLLAEIVRKSIFKSSAAMNKMKPVAVVDLKNAIPVEVGQPETEFRIKTQSGILIFQARNWPEKEAWTDDVIGTISGLNDRGVLHKTKSHFVKLENAPSKETLTSNTLSASQTSPPIRSLNKRRSEINLAPDGFKKGGSDFFNRPNSLQVSNSSNMKNNKKKPERQSTLPRIHYKAKGKGPLSAPSQVKRIRITRSMSYNSFFAIKKDDTSIRTVNVLSNATSLHSNPNRKAGGASKRRQSFSEIEPFLNFLHNLEDRFDSDSDTDY